MIDTSMAGCGNGKRSLTDWLQGKDAVLFGGGGKGGRAERAGADAKPEADEDEKNLVHLVNWLMSAKHPATTQVTRVS